MLTKDQEEAAIKLLQAVHIAGGRATFQEKRALFRLVDVQVLCDGDLIQMAGGVPTQKISRDELYAIANGSQNSSRRLQFGLSDDFLPAESDSSICPQRHNKEYALSNPKSRVRFVATISKQEMRAWDESKGQVIEILKASEPDK